MAGFSSYKPKAEQPKVKASSVSHSVHAEIDEIFSLGERKSEKKGSGKKNGKKKQLDDSDDEFYLPKDDDSQDSLGLSVSFSSASVKHKEKRIKPIDEYEFTEAHQYVLDNMIVPSEQLATFRDVIGGRAARIFAEQWRPTTSGAVRAISGLLLFGPPGTGKTTIAQAIAQFIGASFYKLGAKDLPGQTDKAAKIIKALFDIAMDNKLPAVIFIDEVDTVFSTRATSRGGALADVFERFQENLLVIGASNNPNKILDKIDKRFERKILIDNPNSQARKSLIVQQLAENENGHGMTEMELDDIVQQTAGRSAVNMERLISSAALRASFAPVEHEHFLEVMQQEPSDFVRDVAATCAKYDAQYGWHP